ncbi:MAG: putative choloylglycine hydrolase [Gammaproteobacteria bacterium]|jgi:predicted choloylglycine hydrolase
MIPNTQMNFTFRSISEDKVGSVWQQEFDLRWPAYRKWFLRYGESNRPTYFESLQALQRYMPEMVPVYEDMVELAGGGDHVARFLSHYCPPPLFRGCSQAVYLKDEPVIVRNYDYSPYVFDGLVMRSHFDKTGVIAMIDCMSGVLDGMNQHGLAVSMSFGGIEKFGEGFGITILLRYILEYASNVKEAVELVKDIPVHGAYNVTLLDRQANFSTLMMAPGETTREIATQIATNHQQLGGWPRYEEKVQTALRHDYLTDVIAQQQDDADSFAQKFLQPPLYNTQFARGFGTLYTAAYYPCRSECRYIWPDNEWRFNFDNFLPTDYHINFFDPEGYPDHSNAYAEVYTNNRIPGLQF